MTKRLLVVHHTVSPAMHALHAAAMDGARDPAITGVEVVTRPALDAPVVEVMEADAYLLGSPVNLGYISGALKYFFDQIYYPCLEATAGRPFVAYLHGNGDATGALRAVESITTGLRWKAARPPVVATGEPTPDQLAEIREAAAALAAGLTLGD